MLGCGIWVFYSKVSRRRLLMAVQLRFCRLLAPLGRRPAVACHQQCTGLMFVSGGRVCRSCYGLQGLLCGEPNMITQQDGLNPDTILSPTVQGKPKQT